jgi:glucosylceramidase
MLRSIAISAAGLFSFLLSIHSFAQKNTLAEQWLTTGDSTVLFSKQTFSSKAVAPTTGTIVIDDTRTFQPIDGFGFALTQGSAMPISKMTPSNRSALLHELFDTVGNAIGVSYLRLSIGASDLNERVFSYDDVAPGETDPELAHFDLGPDHKDVIPVLKEILKINPRIKILGSPWSPPAWMKTNMDTRGGRLKTEYYPSYAKYFVKYITAMAKEGITIDAITVQNEPLHPGNNPSLLLTAPEEAAFIKNNLGPAFRDAGLDTKIIIYDHNPDRPDYALDVLKDPEAKKYIDCTGFHLYDGSVEAFTYVHDQHPDKHIYFTEQMVVQFGENRDGKRPKLDIARPVSEVFIGATRNWSRNVLEWNLAANSRFTPYTERGGCSMCQGAVSIDGEIVTRNLAYYAMAHFSKFISPGAVRIGSGDVKDLPNVAFKNSNGKIVLVVANSSNTPGSFAIKLKGKSSFVSIPAKSVATYIFN